MYKKAQSDPKELVLTLIIAGILFIVSLLIFANISNSTDSLLDPTLSHVNNETLGTINIKTAESVNSTLIAGAGYIANSEVVINNSGKGITLTRNVDYKIGILLGPSGALTSRGNFTLLDIVEPSGFNGTELLIDYQHNVESDSQSAVNTVESTVLDAFELGMISLIVLAAVVILAVLFRLGG